jgi:uncharacterized protein (TIGR02266 family)
VSDAPTTARNARDALARALNALQADPNVPPALMDLAAPIAQAMGALMNVERTGVVMPHADVALNNVRTSLQSLQQQPSTHPAVAQAMEAVASSLGIVHTLWRMGQPGVAQPAPAQAVAPAFPPQPPRPGGPVSVPRPAQAAPPLNFQPPPPPFQPPPPPPQAYQPAPQQAVIQPPPAQPMHFAPTVPQDAGVVAPTFNASAGAPIPQPAPQAPAPPPQRAMPAGDSPVINADLGTHSPTNFYKGLSGNDIIDHGGLFVSTYMVPKIGTPVRLKVSLPGGYEFEANAVVSWSREPSEGGNDAPPGFGARFTQITPEARQLVYRYVRNREPLFHDDL